MVTETVVDVIIVMLYAAASTWLIAVAGTFFVEYYVGARGLYVLFGVMAFLLLAVYFLMISMSGGSSPLIRRADIVWVIRATMMVAIPLGWIWLFRRWKAHILIRWRDGENGDA